MVTGVTQMFLAAVQIAGPLLVVLFLADVGLGLLTRVAPALNAFALGFPLKILLTLMLGGCVFVALPRIVSVPGRPGRDDADGGGLGVAGRLEERTEQATDKRMKEVRQKGQLAKSQDLTAWLGVGAAAVMLPVTIERGAAGRHRPDVHRRADRSRHPDPGLARARRSRTGSARMHVHARPDVPGRGGRDHRRRGAAGRRPLEEVQAGSSNSSTWSTGSRSCSARRRSGRASRRC